MPIPRAIRLYFKKTKKGLKLVRSRHVNMRAPAVLRKKFLKKKDADVSTGFWLDVKNDKGKTLFGRAVPELARDRLEAYTGDDKQPFVVSEKRASDLITIILPYDSEATTMKIKQQFVSLPKNTAGRLDKKKKKSRVRIKSRDLIEIDLRKLDEQGGEK